MTIEYTVSQNGIRIDTFPKGVLDIKQTMDYFDRLKNDTKVRQGAVEVVNFKYVTDFKISYVESEKITKKYQESKVVKTIDTTIFVCATPLEYGIGRMLQTLHEITNPQHKVMIVRSESELEDVLKKG